MVVTERISRYRWVALGIAFLAQWSNALASQAVAPLAPLLQPELGLSNAEVGFFSSAAFAGAWGVLLVAGSLTDRVGVRRMMTLGQMTTGAFMLSLSAVASFLQTVVVMFLAGLGRGVTAPGITKAIMDWFPPGGRATAMGLKQTGVPVAGIVTALTLPALALALGWRSALALVGMLIIAGGIATGVLYRDPQPSEPAARRVLGMRASVGQVARQRSLWVLSSVAVLLVSVQLAITTYLALYFKEVVLVPLVPEEPTRIVAAGGYLALCQAGGVFGRVFWGVVSDRVFHGRRLVVLAMTGGLSAMISLAVGRVDSGYPLWLLTGIVFVYGATAIGWNGLYQALIVETAGRRYAGTGVGLSMTLSQFGTVGGPPLFGFVVDLTGSFQTAWQLLACLSGVGAVVAVVNARGERHVA